MKLPVLVLAATAGLVLSCTSTYAQTPPAAPSGPATTGPALGTSGAAGAGPSEDGHGKVKEIRQACRGQLEGQGLKGEERMKAVSACVVKQRPDLAQREGCRMTGFEKGLRKDELHGFVKDCMKGKS